MTSISQDLPWLLMCDSTDRQLDPRPPIGPKAIIPHVSCPNLNLLLTREVTVLLKLMSRV